MGLLSDWGFSSQSWQGQRGEYWVLAQAGLLLGFAVLPVYCLNRIFALTPPLTYATATIAAGLGAIALILILKGLLDLGSNLTPLPHPKNDSHLVQTGVYGIVRHPLYSGLILAAIAWAICWLSLPHLIGALILFIFFNAKANREETWLAEKYPEYEAYSQRVKKLIPWVY